MQTLAIITARGGSKRIPKKNIKDFCGKPIIAYSIAAALESNAFDRVVVSTDSREIASVAEAYGAEVPFLRSDETANDTATTADVLHEVLMRYRELGTEWDSFCCLYPTAPFITPDRLTQAMGMLQEQDVDSVIPVIPFGYPPQRSFRIVDGTLQYSRPEYERVRSQDLEKLYHDSGQFYACKTKAFLKSNSLVMDRTLPIVLSELEAQDIDSEEDWKLAELKYMMLYGEHA